MVFGSHSKTCAIYSIPPCPSFAASTAAYRRRSFSDSQLKNRFIFPLTSTSYTSMLPSLPRDLLCSKDTMAQAVWEVILDHILSRQWHDPTQDHEHASPDDHPGHQVRWGGQCRCVDWLCGSPRPQERRTSGGGRTPDGPARIRRASDDARTLDRNPQDRRAQAQDWFPADSQQQCER